MRKLILVPVFVLLLGGIQAVVPGSHVSAKHRLWHCCSPGMCDTGCYCCNKTIYCTCAVPDDVSIHPDVHADNVTVNIRRTREPRAFAVSKLNAADTLHILMSGSRARGKFVFRLLEGYENGLKVWCPGAEVNSGSDNVVALNDPNVEEK